MMYITNDACPSSSWFDYFQAIKKNKKDQVLTHIKNGKDPQINIDGPLNSLDVAAKYGHDDLVELFLRHLRPRTRHRSDAGLILYPAFQQALDNDQLTVLRILSREAEACLGLPLTLFLSRDALAFSKEVLYYDGRNEDVINYLLDNPSIFYFVTVETEPGGIVEESNVEILRKICFVPKQGREDWATTAMLWGTMAVQNLKQEDEKETCVQVVCSNAIAAENMELLDELVLNKLDSFIVENMDASIGIALKYHRTESLLWLLSKYEIPDLAWEIVSHKWICNAPFDMAKIVIDKKARLPESSRQQQLGLLIQFACAYNRPDILTFIVETYDFADICFVEFNFLVLPCYVQILRILLKTGLYHQMYSNEERRTKGLNCIFEGVISDINIRFPHDYCGHMNCPKSTFNNTLRYAAETDVNVSLKSSFLLPPAVLEMLLPIVTPSIPSSTDPGALNAYFSHFLRQPSEEDRQSSLFPKPLVHCTWSEALKHALISLSILSQYDPLRPELRTSVTTSCCILTQAKQYNTRFLIARRYALHAFIPGLNPTPTSRADAVSEFLSISYSRFPRYSTPHGTDAMIRDGLLSMAGSGSRIQNCLHFITSTPERQQYFSNLVQQCGLTAETPGESLVPISMRNKLCKQVLELSSESSRRLPLASQCRLAILRRLRQNQAWNIETGSHDPRFRGLSVWDMVNKLDLPQPILSYLRFSDQFVNFKQCFKQ